MTFVYPLLLGGLALVGIPVLLHLIMRQKPKHLPFPAIRFLLQRKRTNQRRLKLRHLLLLALRMFLLAAICLALARPKIFSERLNLTSDRPVAAALVFDSSFSMEYGAGGQNRLEEAKRRSLELLADLPQGSRVAIFDTAESGGEWLPSLSQARERINNLELRAANYPVTSQLTPAYELLAKLDEEADNPDEAPLRFLYVFSDRTQACWNTSHVEKLQRIRDRLPPPGVHAVFVDVGVDNPATVAISGLELPKQVVAGNERILVRATVQATGARCDTEVLCKIDDKEPIERKPVTLEAGQSRVITFERRGLSPGMHQAEVSLASRDALPFACVRFATFEVQRPRKVLTITDDVRNARIWKLALETKEAFECDLMSTTEARNHLFRNDLAKYQAACLVGVARPDQDLWEKLAKLFVADGGGLAVIPGGDELERDAYDSEAAQALLPARLVKAVKVVKTEHEKGVVWSAATYQHPLMAPFGEWSKGEPVDFLAPETEPSASRYWEVEPRPNNESFVIVAYNEKKPALLERNFDRQKLRGRVLLFTTPLDDSHVSGKDLSGNQVPRWNSYVQNSSFYLVLAQKTIGYLAGDADGGNFNYQCGQAVPVPVPASSRFPTYTVQGPGLTSAEAIVPRAENQTELQITKAVVPGNYRVYGTDGLPMAAFSLNVPADESQLNRVPVEQIEALFGPGALLPLDRKTSLHEALQNHWSQPVELLPWLMLFVLLALVVENLLANKFYRQEPPENDEEKVPAN
jgi:hypothetical protein